MKVDVFARMLAILALAVSVGHLLLNYFIWVRSGGRLKIRLKLIKHHYDPMQHHLLLTVTNIGRGQARIAAVGIRQQVQEGTGLSMTLVPKGDPLPRFLEPGARMEAEGSMSAIVKRWDPDVRLVLKGWAELEDGRPRESPFQSVAIKTPHAGADESKA